MKIRQHARRPGRNTLRLIVIMLMGGLFCFSSSRTGIAKNADNSQKYKILHVMSYHASWKWNDNQFNGFKDATKGLDVEYKVFEMDTKRQSAQDWKE
jgi:hypothetical protein